MFVFAIALLLLGIATPVTALSEGDVGTIVQAIGVIEVTSNPSEASVNYGGSYEGTTPVTIKVYTTDGPDKQIVVSLSGYKTYTTKAPNPGIGETEHVHAVLEPITPIPRIPVEGYFAIDSQPRDATIFIDGHYQGTTPLTTMVTAETTHRIQIEYSGYESWSGVYTTYSGQTTPVYAALTQNQPTTGFLAVTSSPSGADVYVDGSYRGYAPMTVGNLNGGSHSVELRKAGYQVYQSNAEIYSGQTSMMNAILSQSTPTTGSVGVQSIPSGASIYLDGNYEGTTMSNDYFDIIDLSTGSHTITLRIPGYNDYSTSVTVTGGSTDHITATLTQQIAPVTVGKVSVNSAPSGAEVIIDNLFRGYAPVVVPDIAPGTHSILLKLQGYNDWSNTVEVNAGQIAEVFGTMDASAPVPTPTKSGSLPIAAVSALGLFGVLFIVQRRR
jgi:hypothetical protein